MNQQNFQHDKRLRGLNQKRLEHLTHLAEQLSAAPENQKMSVFLSIMQEMKADPVSFSPDEQDLLFSVLTENMSEKDRKNALLIRQLSTKLMQK